MREYNSYILCILNIPTLSTNTKVLVCRVFDVEACKNLAMDFGFGLQ